MDEIAEIARQWLMKNPVFLDTETTGLDGAEICDIAIVAANGSVLLNTLVKPTIPIPAGATAVHGIADADVANAPSFADVWPEVKRLLAGREVVIYNAAYDRARLLDSAAAVGLSAEAHETLSATACHCAMELYAEFFGEWNSYHGSYRWQKLGDAGRQCRVALPSDMKLHRALADAELTRQIVLHVAAAIQEAERH